MFRKSRVIATPGDLLRVGACSMVAVPGDIDGNLEKIQDWIRQAVAERVELLLFPELSLSGYWINSELYYEAQPRDGPAVRALVAFLREIDADLVVSVGLAESHEGCLYNTQVLLDRNGERGYYRKTHWPHAEVGTWGCGTRYPVHRVGNFALGTTTCYDTNFPEVHRIYALQGTDLILAPYAYGDKFDPAEPETERAAIRKWKDREMMVLRAAAALNYQWIVACVGGGHVQDYIADQHPDSEQGEHHHFPGVIFFVDPTGKVVLESPDDKIAERLHWYDVSRIANVEARRSNNNFFKNRRPLTYGRVTEAP